MRASTLFIEIRVHRKFSSRVNRARVKRAAARAWDAEMERRAAPLGQQGIRPMPAQASAALTIYVTTDSEIRLLNRKFHGTNAATDVLSFPARSVEWRAALAVARGTGEPCPYLGDIVISHDRARIQARAAKWHIADEMDLLVVHGLLHFLGYDDLTHRKRTRMWKRQSEILGKSQGAGGLVDVR